MQESLGQNHDWFLEKVIFIDEIIYTVKGQFFKDFRAIGKRDASR